MDWSFGAAALIRTLYIHWKYFPVGQPGIQLTLRYVYLGSIPTFELEYFNLL